MSPVIRARDFQLGGDELAHGIDGPSLDIRQVALCTVRLECRLDGSSVRRGSGFFYEFSSQRGSPSSVIITNTHVVQGAKSVSFHLCAADADGNPVRGRHHQITVESIERFLVYHPDKAVDLCAILLDSMHAVAASEGMKLCYRTIPETVTISEVELALIGPVEDVIVVGYPVGLWDSVNNRPVVRRGITATPLDVDFDGRPEFLIDAASFEGSSGSPVFRYQSPLAQIDPDHFDLLTSPRIRFVGILARGEEHARRAELTNVLQTSDSGAYAGVDIPLHIGHVIKASTLEPLVQYLRQLSTGE
jgi:hypothetical protein